MIATGPGAEMKQALGTAVFAGMLGVTLFGLFLTPVFYVAVRSVVLAASRRRPVKRSEPGGPQPSPAE
jgi:HAE1 family hydrophobic/amphiphilic exporter-1